MRQLCQFRDVLVFHLLAIIESLGGSNYWHTNCYKESCRVKPDNASYSVRNSKCN
ncbi:hypothetical protein K8T06_10385 [bacterium]|nr:hypothetical protein [bacterium]